MILDRIAKETGLPVSALRTIAVTASHRYKSYYISKRTGGLRVISHPTPPLKFLQRWLNRNVFIELPVHDAVKSYRHGIGIRELALPHVRSSYLLRLDFHDFFPSLTGGDITWLLNRNVGRLPFKLENGDLDLIVQLTCKNNRLTIGAPSSPVLSNCLLFDIDAAVQKFCKENEVVYTRYADDLYFSTDIPNTLTRVNEVVRETLRVNEHPRLKINEKKTVFTSRKRKRMVTGLVLSSVNEISIGRKKKRFIRHKINEYKNGRLAPQDISYLLGYLSFVKSVEPGFIVSLRKKYGEEIFARLAQEDLTPRKATGPSF